MASVVAVSATEQALLVELGKQTTTEGWLAFIRALAALKTTNQTAYEAQIKEHLDKEAAKRAVHVIVGHPPGVIIGPGGILTLHGHPLGYPLDIFGRPMMPGVYFR
jgi:hypothetical protein